jgi:hypothetical protein
MGRKGTTASNEYRFVTHWRVRGNKDELIEILGNAPDLVRWWPSVYLGAEKLAEGEEERVGESFALYTKGWLPYTLRWKFTVTHVEPGAGMAFDVDGDFVGRGEWRFAQDGEQVDIVYDWQIEARKPLLRRLSFLLRPLFAANHRWAMRKGLESLNLELARRHASPEQRAMIPPPPGPARTSLVLLFAPASVVAAAVLLLRTRGSHQ